MISSRFLHRLFSIALALGLHPGIAAGVSADHPGNVSGLPQPGAITFSEGHAACAVRVTTDPPAGEWKLSNQSGAAEGSSTGGYRMKLIRGTAPDGAGHVPWNFQLERDDGAHFRVKELAYEARIPLGRVAAIFDTRVPEQPSIFRQAPQIDVVLEIRPNAGIPFLMACDHYGFNSLAAGPIDQAGTYRMIGRRVGDDYLIRIQRDEYAGDGWFTGRRFEDGVFLSTEKTFWFDTAQAYADTVDEATGYRPRPIPDHATLPFYSTWYAFGEDIRRDVVWENARLASEMGIGNMLIFIGWATCRDWFSTESRWGDYTPCPERFAEFGELVRRIRDDLDMHVQVWVAPTWIGEGAESFAAMQELRSKWPGGGYDRNLDPRHPDVRAHIRARFAHLVKAYGVDGVYIDFLDTIYNRNDAEHAREPAHFGTALDAFLGSVYDGLAEGTAAPMVTCRMPFANLLTKHHANVFTTTYTNHNWDRNRTLAISHRPFNRGVISTTDPLVWTGAEFEDRDLVGRTLSAMMLLGPPGISMDLTRMREDRRRNLADWFGFYNRHRDNLVRGRFIPFGDEFHYPEMMVARGDTAYAWVSRWETDHIPFPEGTRHAFIFTNLPREESFIARIDLTNITGLEPGRYRARWFNSTLESHDPPFELTVKPRREPASAGEARTARENWDFPPDDERPSLDVRRGGCLELEYSE